MIGFFINYCFVFCYCHAIIHNLSLFLVPVSYVHNHFSFGSFTSSAWELLCAVVRPGFGHFLATDFRRSFSARMSALLGFGVSPWRLKIEQTNRCLRTMTNIGPVQPRPQASSPPDSIVRIAARMFLLPHFQLVRLRRFRWPYSPFWVAGQKPNRKNLKKMFTRIHI